MLLHSTGEYSKQSCGTQGCWSHTVYLPYTRQRSNLVIFWKKKKNQPPPPFLKEPLQWLVIGGYRKKERRRRKQKSCHRIDLYCRCRYELICSDSNLPLPPPRRLLLFEVRAYNGAVDPSEWRCNYMVWTLVSDTIIILTASRGQSRVDLHTEVIRRRVVGSVWSARSLPPRAQLSRPWRRGRGAGTKGSVFTPDPRLTVCPPDWNCPNWKESNSLGLFCHHTTRVSCPRKKRD